LLSLYDRMNRRSSRWLWWVVAVALLASSPLIYAREQMETSSPNVEIVFDYRDLTEVSGFKSDPEAFLEAELKKLKQIGIQSMAVYESTLDELRTSRRLQLYTATEYALLTGNAKLTKENSTYLLFTDAEAQAKLTPLIEQTFRQRLKVNIRTWSYNNQDGLIIEMPYEEATMKPMLPDPMAMDIIQRHGFHIVARLSNRIQPYSASFVDSMLKELASRGVRTIIFDGTAVTGYDEEPKDNHVEDTAALMRKHGIQAAVIEPVNIKEPQLGFSTLAHHLKYRIVRLHSISERDANLDPERIADKLVLAVKDRNIRLLFLNTRVGRDLDKGFMNDYLENIHDALTGPEGAIERIQANGFTFGQAEAFRPSTVSGLLKLPAIVGGVALIALLVGCYLPALRLFSFGIGLVGMTGLLAVVSTLAQQMLALGVGVSAASLALIVAIRKVDQVREEKHRRVKGWGSTFIVFGQAVVISLAGAGLIVELLSNISYILLLQQFRGVNLLAFAPVLLVAVYVFAFRGTNRLRDVLDNVRKLLATPVSILWVVGAAAAGAAGWYYLSRTGNEGQALDIERLFRALLEDKMGVRPRTKEFLIAHPLMIAGIYFGLKYRNAVYVMIAGAIGQASLIGTYTHLHTPLVISTIRVGYGILLGIVIGMIGVQVLKLLMKGWKRWVPPLER
jgi:hypothetical protein